MSHLARLTAALHRLDSLAVVNGPAKCDEKHNNGAGRVIVNLWCRSNHDAKDKQPYIGLNQKPLSDPKAVPSYDVAAERLLALVESKHMGCVEAAQAARMGWQPLLKAWELVPRRQLDRNQAWTHSR